MADEVVGGIGLELTLGTSQFDAAIERSEAKLKALGTNFSNQISVPLRRGAGQAQQIYFPGQAGGGGAREMQITPTFTAGAGAVRGLRTQLRSQLAAEAIPLTFSVGRQNYGQLRREIAAGIGAVPITVTYGGGQKGGTLDVVTAVVAQASGISKVAARQQIRGAMASHGVDPQVLEKRASGGPVSAHRTYRVNERGEEFFTPQSAGHVTAAHEVARLRREYEQLQRSMGGYARAARGAAPNFYKPLAAAASRLTPETIAAGKAWYPNAAAYGAEMAQRYGVPVDSARGMLAVLSAGTEWRSNQTKFEKILQAHAAGKPFPYSTSLDAHAKAKAILEGGDPKLLARGPKISQFYKGVSGDLSALTLDIWATRTSVAGLPNISESMRAGVPPKTGPWRKKLEQAWARAGRESGLEPAEFQAALWIQEKQESDARARLARAARHQPAGALSMGFKAGGRVGGLQSAKDVRVRSSKRMLNAILQSADISQRYRGLTPFSADSSLAMDIEQGLIPEQDDIDVRDAFARHYGHMAAGGPAFRRVPADRFHSAISSASQVVKSNGRRVGETVYVYPKDEYGGMKTFLSKDGLTGYAVKPDGDLVSVFNVGQKGAGERAIRSGIRHGAKKLDAFDETGNALRGFPIDPRNTKALQAGRLPSLYGKFGFKEIGRDLWNPDYAPEGWQGEDPDVVYMRRMRGRGMPGQLRLGLAQGGPAKKGGLPRGYSLEFYTPGETEEDPVFSSQFLAAHQSVKLFGKKMARPTDVGKVRTYLGSYNDVLSAVVSHKGKVVATAPFSVVGSKLGEKGGYLHPELTHVDPDHEGKGLATAMYVKAEKFAGKQIRPAVGDQTVLGSGLWLQKNRPFGKKFQEEVDIIRESLAEKLWVDGPAEGYRGRVPHHWSHVAGIPDEPLTALEQTDREANQRRRRAWIRSYGREEPLRLSTSGATVSTPIRHAGQGLGNRAAGGPAEAQRAQYLARRAKLGHARSRHGSGEADRLAALRMSGSPFTAQHELDLAFSMLSKELDATQLGSDERIDAMLSILPKHMAAPEEAGMGRRFRTKQLLGEMEPVPYLGFGKGDPRKRDIFMGSHGYDFTHQQGYHSDNRFEEREGPLRGTLGEKGFQYSHPLEHWSRNAMGGSVKPISYGAGFAHRAMGGGVGYVNYELDDVRKDLQSRITDTLDNLLTLYPSAYDRGLDRVGLNRRLPPYAQYDSDAKSITFAHSAAVGSTDYYTRAGRLIKDKGFHTPGTSSIEGNTTHEFAHALRRGIVERAGGVIGKDLSELGPNNPAVRLMKLEETLKDPAIAKTISRYASQGAANPWFMGGGPFEPFAEMFSGIHTPGGKVGAMDKGALGQMTELLEIMRGRRRASGGQAGAGPYIVNENGRELFVPKRLEHQIPADVMRQIPHRKDGGIAEINQQPWSLFNPPEDGWIIPNHLKNKVPRAHVGSRPMEGGDPEEPYQDASGQWHAGKSGRHISAKSAAAAQRRVGRRAAASYRFEGLAGGFEPTLRARENVPPPTDAMRERVAALSNPQNNRASPTTFVGASALRLFGGGKERAAAKAQVIEADDFIKGWQKSLRKELGRTVDPLQHMTSALVKAQDAYETSEHTIGKNATATKRLGAVQETLAKDVAHLEDAYQQREKGLSVLEKPQSGLRGLAALQGSFALYQVGLTAVSTAMELGLKAASPFIDSLSNFSGAALKVGTELSGQTRQLGASAGVAIAGAAGQAGVGGAGLAYLQKNLTPTITAQAAGQAAAEALDLQRAAFFAQTSGKTPGLTGGPTGGLAGSGFGWQVFGGQESFSQTVARGISESAGAAALRPGGRAEGGRGGGFGAPPTREALAELQQKAAAGQDRLEASTSDFNEAIGRGATFLGQNASSLQLMTKEQILATGAIKEADWPGIVDQFKAVGASAQDADNANTEAAAGVLLFDKTTGQVVQSAVDYKKTLQQAAQGILVQSKQSYAEQSRMQINAAKEASAAQGELERRLFAPYSFASAQYETPPVAGQAAAPLTGAKGTFFGKGGGDFLAGIQSRLAAVQSSAESRLAQSTRDVEAMAGEISTAIGPDAASAFSKSMSDVLSLGQQISDKQVKITQAQSGLRAAETANNLRLASRSLSDALGLAGRGGGSRLGGLQREQTQIGFNLQQRDINLEKAVAGFQVAGESPGERAARQNAAVAKADISQRLLDIAKESFTITANRGVTDASATVRLLHQSQRVEADVIANSAEISDLQQQQARKAAQAQTYVTQATKNINTDLDIAAGYVQRFGGTIDEARKKIREALGLGPQGSTSSPGGPDDRGQAYLPLTTAQKEQERQTNDPTLYGDPTRIGYAGGIVGYAPGRTDITLGEAKGEAVAILRNPKRRSLGSGDGLGGSTTIQLNIHNPVIREEQDIARLAQAIEDRLSTRLSMIRR